MPVCFSHASLPPGAIAAPPVRRCSGRALTDVDGGGQGSVQVPDVHLAVVAPAVHVARVGAARWREMTADQRPLHAMATESDKRVVVRMSKPDNENEFTPAVVEIGTSRVLHRVALGELGRAHGHPQVPQLHALIFAVGQDIPAVSFAIDIRQAFAMAHGGTRFAAAAHAASIPDLESGIVGPGVEDMWRHLIGEADGIDVVSVAGNVV